MKKIKLLIIILTGLMVGHVFAEGDRPFKVVNTLRVGYDDNVFRTKDNQTGSAFVEDIVDLSFRAALSDRTDLIFKSRFKYRSDKENLAHPNLYAVLIHSVSPRLMIQLSDKFLSGTKTSATAGGRYAYLDNTLSFSPSYVLSPKDSLSAPISYRIKRNEDEIEDEDADIISAGFTWKRALSPQRTWVALNLSQTMVDYINRDSSTDYTRITAQISHTFNPRWQGNVEGGVTFNQSDFSRMIAGTNVNVNSEAVSPYFAAGLVYTPSPVTRFSANISQMFKESESAFYAGENARALTLGAQHEFTPKILGKLTGRFVQTEREERENEMGTGTTEEEFMELEMRFHYKLNRINFLELGFRHREKTYDYGDRDWNQNMVDIGWRVEL